MEITSKVEKRIDMVLFLTSNIGGIKKENGKKNTCRVLFKKSIFIKYEKKFEK